MLKRFVSVSSNDARKNVAQRVVLLRTAETGGNRKTCVVALDHEAAVSFATPRHTFRNLNAVNTNKSSKTICCEFGGGVHKWPVSALFTSRRAYSTTSDKNGEKGKRDDEGAKQQEEQAQKPISGKKWSGDPTLPAAPDGSRIVPPSAGEETTATTEKQGKKGKDVVSHASNLPDEPLIDRLTRPMTAGEEGQVSTLHPVPEPGKDDNIAEHETGPDGIERIKKLPLTLVEEVPKDVYVLPEIELLLRSWSEEQYTQMRLLMFVARGLMAIIIGFFCYLVYRARVAVERRRRGVGNMPSNLKIGSVVFLDMADEAGKDLGRVVIGLLNENCPLYCEYFHRRCTGNGPNGESFVGVPLQSNVPGFLLIFGEGENMVVGLPGFDEKALPNEFLPDGMWRGAVSAVPRPGNKQTGNFAFNIAGGETSNQVFGIVMAGFDALQGISGMGVRYGSAPKVNVVVKRCGELCTLDKAKVMPMPWQLYDSVSWGYDEETFGQSMASRLREMKDEAAARAEAAVQLLARPWWKKLLNLS